MGSPLATAELQELVQLPAGVTRTRVCFLLHIRPERLAEYVGDFEIQVRRSLCVPPLLQDLVPCR